MQRIDDVWMALLPGPVLLIPAFVIWLGGRWGIAALPPVAYRSK
ncbi:hypothetical protein [Thalassolituus maritimus]|nr:hypothetical protein [Thalassolituus maritimus]